MNLDEMAAFLGCTRHIVVDILTALGIPPLRITKSGRRRWGTLKSAQIRRVILEYNRIRAGKSVRAGKMRGNEIRHPHFTGPERLERYYLAEKERNRKRAERRRAKRRAARVAVVTGLSTSTAAVRAAAPVPAVATG